MDKGEIAYAFVDENGAGVTMYEVESLDRADWLVKRDPLFPYASFETIPTISSDALVIEAQDYLGEQFFEPESLGELLMPKRSVQNDGEYWLAWKEVPPFSPMVPKEVQDDVHRRTVIAQQAHTKSMEFADDNPVGRPIGILIAEAPFDEVDAHVRSCEVYPDTEVKYTRLYTLWQEWYRTAVQLTEAGHDVMRPTYGEWRDLWAQN